MKRRTLIHLLAMAIFLLAARSAQAATYYVAPNGNDANPGTQASPFRNIARGITAAAASGDTVEVAAGTYAERLTWSSKSLLLKGAGTGQSIIDGGGTGRCLQLSSVPSTARIEGFTVQNGNSGSGDGGGINLDGSSPTVANCVFQLNQATRGGGMNANGSSPTVTDCLFSGNSAGGGGLANNFGSNPVFKRCVFLNNSDSNGAGGMAIRGGSPTLENCLVRGNVDRGLVTRKAPACMI